jgi:galactose mutarotase-like enzyme
MISIQNDILEARFTAWRAELVALRDHRRGRDFLWNGDPTVWKGHAPILFPIVGMVPADSVAINGRPHTLRQHGFAPTSTFEVVQSAPTTCAFRLVSSPETLAAYPFDFSLDIVYALEGATLSMLATVSNRSATEMPFSFGFHPGFCWPLPGAGPRDQHAVEFAEDERSPIRRPLNGLLDPVLHPTPVAGRTLALSDDLFEQGAVMFDQLASRSLRFGTEQGPSLEIEWRNLPHLGIWSRPGAGYLCIEPWQGYSALPDFDGELAAKPGTILLEPGMIRDFSMTVTIVDQPGERS